MSGKHLLLKALSGLQSSQRAFQQQLNPVTASLACNVWNSGFVFPCSRLISTSVGVMHASPTPSGSESHTGTTSSPSSTKSRTSGSSSATAAAAAAATSASEKVLHAFKHGHKATTPTPQAQPASTAAAEADHTVSESQHASPSSSNTTDASGAHAASHAHAEPSSSGTDGASEAGKATADSNSTGSSAGAAGSSSDSSSSSEQQQDSSSGSSSSSAGVKSAGVKAAEMLRFVSKEVSDTLLGVQNVHSATAAYMGERAPEAVVGEEGGPSELVLVVPVLTPWQKGMAQMRERLSKLPFLSKLAAVDVTATTPYKRGVELAEGLKDRWETSDHPAVHKVEDVKARYFSGSDASKAMAEIRARDPDFDMNGFVQSVKLDAPSVSKAFLRHDLPVLKQHCGPELIQRFQGIFKHFADQGLFEDPTILFVGDVEIVEVRMLDDDPFIIAQFHCQQLKCTRDSFGNVVDGSSETIQRVYYFWGMSMEKERVVTADGKLLPPRWVIKDMMWQSMLALV